jgi:hypothetical protein
MFQRVTAPHLIFVATEVKVCAARRCVLCAAENSIGAPGRGSAQHEVRSHDSTLRRLGD